MPMTYASLINQVTNYLDRTDSSTLAQIPNFIEQAEQRICRESKSVGLEMYVSSNFITGQSTYQKPALWRRNISLSCIAAGNVITPIDLRSYEFVRDYWYDPTVTGVPIYYCDYGYYNFMVAPTPAEDFPYELSYLGLPPLLSISNQTNWLTDYAPDVLLYATLLETAPYLKVDDRVQTWMTYYEKGIKSLNEQDDQRITDRASNRTAD